MNGYSVGSRERRVSFCGAPPSVCSIPGSAELRGVDVERAFAGRAPFCRCAGPMGIYSVFGVEGYTRCTLNDMVAEECQHMVQKLCTSRLLEMSL